MSLQSKLALSRKRRAQRVRARIVGNNPRISVFRSLNHIYAQLINDAEHHTLASCSSMELEKVTGDKKAVAKEVGKELAKKALKLGINAAVLDRGACLYHGRVEALAEGLREGGLKI